MGRMYYGRYAELFEVGRVEALRSLGFPYRRIEEEGILLPVLDLQVRYLRPVLYDRLITIRTAIIEPPAARIRFAYELRDEEGLLLTEASTALVFLDAATMRPCRAPKDLGEALAPHFAGGGPRRR
jgi:acyl-CoA thioester hydrolase